MCPPSARENRQANHRNQGVRTKVWSILDLDLQRFRLDRQGESRIDFFVFDVFCILLDGIGCTEYAEGIFLCVRRTEINDGDNPERVKLTELVWV